jgi:hypothetical protein
MKTLIEEFLNYKFDSNKEFVLILENGNSNIYQEMVD